MNRVRGRIPGADGGLCIYQTFHTDSEAAVRSPVVARVENQVDDDGQNLIAVLHTLYTESREFKRDLNIAMEAAFGEDFDKLEFPPAADQRIQLRLHWKSLRRGQPAADLADGILRFLYLMAILANPTPPPLIAIDEPETGLNPSMFPIVAEYALEASRTTQLILCTHSPEFLDAFRHTVPTTTVLEWHDGQTELKVLSEKTLAYWLKECTLGGAVSLQRIGGDGMKFILLAEGATGKIAVAGFLKRWLD